MSAGEFMDGVMGFFGVLGLWIMSESVYRVLILLLVTLNLIYWVYQALSHWSMRRRVMRVELKHDALLHRIIAVHGEVTDLRRQSRSADA